MHQRSNAKYIFSEQNLNCGGSCGGGNGSVGTTAICSCSVSSSSITRFNNMAKTEYFMAGGLSR